MNIIEVSKEEVLNVMRSFHLQSWNDGIIIGSTMIPGISDPKLDPLDIENIWVCKQDADEARAKANDEDD